MTTLKQNGASNDICIDDSGDIALASGLDAYATIIADEIRTCLGELQLNTEVGIPYFETIFKGVNAVSIWRMYVTRATTALPFVKNIRSMDVEIDSQSKVLSYTMEVETDEGVVTVSQ